MRIRLMSALREALHLAIERHKAAAQENEEVSSRVEEKKNAEAVERDDLRDALERVARRVNKRGH